MPATCVVFQCSHRRNEASKAKGRSFFRFPEDKRKRRAWVKAINRENWQPSEHSRICSDHFVDGWHSDDPADVNYVPTIFQYKNVTVSDATSARNDRHEKREQTQVRNL